MAARRPRTLHPAPARVWVYYCAACGAPILAETRSDVSVDCPSCPLGTGAVYRARYLVALNPQVRRAAR